MTSLWVMLSLAMVVLAWIAVLRARRAGEELTALLAVAVAGLLVSPISWAHHWVWIAPALLLLTSPAWHRRQLLLVAGLPVLAVFAIGPPWLLPSDNDLEKHWTWWQQLIGNSYVLVGVLFLVLVTFLTRWPASEELVGQNPNERKFMPPPESDLVYLKWDSAGKTAYATVPRGSTSADTRSVGPEGGPWHACGAVNNRPDEVCT